MAKQKASWALQRLLIWRYFAGLRKQGVVGALSGISVLGVAVATGAMVVVLSAFNGLEALIVDLYASWDAGLLVEPKVGKFVRNEAALAQKIAHLAGVQRVHAVAEDNALLRFDGGQAVVRIKGVDALYGQRVGLGKTLVAGNFQLGAPGAWGVVLGAGVAYSLHIPLNNGFEGIQIWYPRAGKSVGLDPRSAFARQAVITTGVFQVEKQYDERYIFADRRLLAALMHQPDACTALELDLLPGTSPKALAHRVQALVGAAYTVKTSAQQHESLMRVLLIERLFVILAFGVILLIASFNIFTALSMLAVEKKRALAVLGAMGASPGLIRNTFLGVGLAISGLGAGLGVGLGVALCWLQDYFKLVSMGMQAAIVQEYPVRVLLPDLVLIASTVVLVSIAVSWVPAQGAVLAAKAGTRAS